MKPGMVSAIEMHYGKWYMIHRGFAVVVEYDTAERRFVGKFVNGPFSEPVYGNSMKELRGSVKKIVRREEPTYWDRLKQSIEWWWNR